MSCTDVVNIIMKIKETSLECNKPTYMCLIDLKKAFDKIWWGKLATSIWQGITIKSYKSDWGKEEEPRGKVKKKKFSNENLRNILFGNSINYYNRQRWNRQYNSTHYVIYPESCCQARIFGMCQESVWFSCFHFI